MGREREELLRIPPVGAGTFKGEGVSRVDQETT